MKRRHRVFGATFFTFVHHLLLATTISSLLLALHATPLYPVLDSLAYSVMASRRAQKTSGGQNAGASAQPRQAAAHEYPLVVILSPHLLAGSEGDKVMPMRLIRLVEANAKVPYPGENPRVLAIVMDLAPMSYDVFEDRLREQTRLDNAMDELRRKMVVVLLEPFIRDDEVGRERFRWLVARCRAGIEFGLPEDRPIGGPVYSYWSNFESAGVLAGKVAVRPLTQAQGARTLQAEVFNVCETAKRHPDDVAAFLKERVDRVPRRSRNLTHERPLNNEYFAFDGNYHRVRSVMPTPWGDTPTLPLGALREARVVFVGVGDNERAKIDGEAVVPADVYAAEFFAERYPVRHLTPWLAFGLDVGLGLGLGYVFAFLWEQYARAAARLEATPLFPLRRKALMYLGTRVGLLGFNLAVLGFVLWGCVRLAGVALDYRLWLSPIPIVLGTCIDGLLHSRRRPDAEEPHDLRGFLTKHFDVVAQVLMIVIALAWVIFRSIWTP